MPSAGDQKPGRPDPSRPPAAAQRPAQASAGASEPTLLVVDGTGLLVRCSMAARPHGLCTSGGIPTGTLLMFINKLAAGIRRVRPRSVVICWDGPGARAWRQEIYPGYKANRDKPRDDWPGDMYRAVEFCNAAGLSQERVTGFEADDVMAAVWRAARRADPGPRVVLCTEDKDLLQLLDGGTVMMPFSSDRYITAADVIRDWDIRDPRYLSWVRALAGDPSDSIPGLSRIGPKKAARLVRESQYDWHLIAVGREDLDQAFAWLSIMNLRTPERQPEDVPGHGEPRFSALVRKEWDPRHSVNLPDLHLLLDKYELRAIRKRLDEGRFW